MATATKQDEALQLHKIEYRRQFAALSGTQDMVWSLYSYLYTPIPLSEKRPALKKADVK